MTIDVICPNCANKALFNSEYEGDYVKSPSKNGKVTCKSCGFNVPFIFSNKYYFYQIPVGNKILYARTLEDLIVLRNYFQKNFINAEARDPELDFPKIFYIRRKEIVKKINVVLEGKTLHN